MKENIFYTYIKTLFYTMHWKVILSVFLMFSVGLTEGFGLLMLIPLLQLTGLQTQEGNIGQLAQFISSLFISCGIPITLITILISYAVIVSINALLNYFQTITNHSLEYNFEHCLREKLYRVITYTNWLFFSRCRSSDFVHALTTELSRVSQGTYFLLQLIVNSVVIFVYLSLALKLSIEMTIVTFLSGFLLLLLFKNKVKEAQDTGEKLSEETNTFYSAIIEHCGGMKTVKSYSAEERNIKIFTDISRRVTEMFTNTISKQANVKLYFDVVSILILSTILYLSLHILQIKTATVLLLLYLFAKVMPRFSGIQQNYHQMISMLPAFAGVLEIQRKCELNKETKQEIKINQRELFQMKSSIKFDHIFFSYAKEKPLFSDLNLNIQHGKTTAIVGPSGSGKSTIADLIMGLLIANEGNILIDQAPLTQEKILSWREQIGYVAQDTFLFHDTIKANLLWACPYANHKEIDQVLESAACTEFIFKLSKGIETVVGERGILLSGGERQRLALARALLRKPSLLILDEATSSLDSENEKRIQNAIEKLHGHLTILVITHRLSTIQNADSIYVLDKGNLVECGAWDALVSNGTSRFKEMWKAQDLKTEILPIL